MFIRPIAKANIGAFTSTPVVDGKERLFRRGVVYLHTAIAVSGVYWLVAKVVAMLRGIGHGRGVGWGVVIGPEFDVAFF